MYVMRPPHGSDPVVDRVIYGFTKLGKATMILVLLLLTSGGDPGIISHNAHPLEPKGFDRNVDVGAGQTPQLRLPGINKTIGSSSCLCSLQPFFVCMYFDSVGCTLEGSWHQRRQQLGELWFKLQLP